MSMSMSNQHGIILVNISLHGGVLVMVGPGTPGMTITRTTTAGGRDAAIMVDLVTMAVVKAHRVVTSSPAETISDMEECIMINIRARRVQMQTGISTPTDIIAYEGTHKKQKTFTAAAEGTEGRGS